MSDTTTNLRLPYIMAAQAQKHVTHNEALRALDVVVQLSVSSRTLSTPPAEATDGERYIVGAGATGTWSSHDSEIAAFQDGAWQFFTPATGWLAWIADENLAVVWQGTEWSEFGGGTNPVDLVGINATADSSNRLSVSAPASLFTHEGSGHQIKINKSAATDTASVLFQTGFSGRAEFGTAGDDQFHVKVSPDGSNWNEAIVINQATGVVSMPNTPAAGGGELEVAKDGANVVAAASKLNFAGAGVAVSDPGDGTATISIPGSGGSGNVPAGGDTGQILAKASDADNHTHWIDPTNAELGVAHPAPSYSNPGGTGDRRSTIAATVTPGLLQAGSIDALLNGDTSTNNYTLSTSFVNGASVAGAAITFDFGHGAAKLIKEARWRQTNASVHGTWRWQGSHDLVTWNDIGTTFTLGGNSAQLQMELAANADAWRAYRLLGVSGTASGNPYLYEVEFKIGSGIFDGNRIPPGGSLGQVLVKSGSANGQTTWGNPLGLYTMHTDGLLAEYYFDDGFGSNVRDLRGNNAATVASSGTFEWTRRGLKLSGARVQTPPLTGGRTAAMLYRLRRGDASNSFLVSALGNALRFVQPQRAQTTEVETVNIGGGGNVCELLRETDGTFAYRLNRGGWQVAFFQFPANGNPKFAFGGRPDNDAADNHPAEVEIAWAGVWSDPLTQAEREHVYAGVRRLAADRGIPIDWRDCTRVADCVILAGQSNADGLAMISDLPAQDQNVRFLRTMIAQGAGSGTPAVPTELVIGQNHALSNSAFGPEIGAALRRENDRLAPLAISKAALGGTFLASSSIPGVGATTTWNAGESLGSGLLYTRLLLQWWEFQQRLLEQGIGPRLRALWWMQGEEDATGTQFSSQYQANLQALWDKVKAASGQSNFKIAVARIRDLDPIGDPAAQAEVRAAQAAFVAANSSDAALIDTDPMSLKPDNVHYDAIGMKALGEAFYNATDFI